MGMLLAAALLAGIAKVFFDLAYNAFLPNLLALEDLLEGNSKLQTSAAAAELAGPGLGGLLAQAVGAVCGILIDALTVLVSAACLAGLRAEPEPRRSRVGKPGVFRQIAEAFGIRTAMWALAVLFAFTRTLPLARSIRTLRDFPAYGADKTDDARPCIQASP